jgi:DNA polymerase I-like protein with 3'-5' exonuclease and polymerase domains
MPTWVRSLVKPEEGRAIAYLDWSSAEFGIAAALSGDPRMKDAYQSGDVYLAFAIMAGAAPPDANKESHADVRELYKKVVLGVQYGQSEFGLSKGLGVPLWRAQELLGLHKRIFARYWQWSEWMSQRAVFSRQAETLFRWSMQIDGRTKPRTITNFPMQGNGAELLRWACCFATEAGIEVHAPVQDALLIGGPADTIGEVVAEAEDAMAKACDLVLDGFILRTDAKIVRYPDRYMDNRGAEMWNRMMRLLDELEGMEVGYVECD